MIFLDTNILSYLNRKGSLADCLISRLIFVHFPILNRIFKLLYIIIIVVPENIS